MQGPRFAVLKAAPSIFIISPMKIIQASCMASGQPFDQFLQSRLFAPLRMVDTGFSVPVDKLACLVAVPGVQPAPLSDGDAGKPQTFFSGGGGSFRRSPTSCASARCCSTAVSLTVRAF
jgi:CubicO group peptidase (beta-lactamase class C family)